MKYPATFEVIERRDEQNSFGEVLTFQSTIDSERIVIGHLRVFGNTRGWQAVLRGAWCVTRGHYAIRNTQYHKTPRNPKEPHLLTELEIGASLQSQISLYEATSTPFDESELERGNFNKIVDGNTITRDGHSPLGYHNTTYFVSGKVIWFVWSNSENSEAYKKFVESFEMGVNIPTTLQEIYGPEFQPMNIEHIFEEKQRERFLPENYNTSNRRTDQLFATSKKNLQNLGYWSPVKGGGLYWYGVTCGHTLPAEQWAVDVPTNAWTDVYSANWGTVVFAGWDNDYGNYVKMHHSSGGISKYSYSAHFNSISTHANAYHTRGTLIGKSGNTGNSNGNHLHFHISYTDLTGMYGFDPGSNYPTPAGSSAQCGLLGRP